MARPHRPVLPALALACALSLFQHPLSAAPDEASWREEYARAKALLVDGRAPEAARALDALAASAPTPVDAAVARELAAVARASIDRRAPAPGPHLRTPDELSILYTSAFVYGLGTGGWMVLLTRPSHLAGAALPFVGFTTAAVGGVAMIDAYKPFRRGVPHSIAAGLYLGLGEAVWVIGLEHAAATRRADGSRWSAEMVGTALWSGATLGGIVGGVVGAWREPTPGRVSFTSSAATWAGVTSGFLAAAVESRDRSRGETAMAVGGVGYNLGLVGGIVVAPLLAPSVARVRFADLGAVGGGLLGAGAYAVAAERTATVRGGLGFAALGMASGLGLTWWLTEGMPRDPSADASVHATLVPTAGGLLGVLRGEL
jgi:hypothetical protein